MKNIQSMFLFSLPQLICNESYRTMKKLAVIFALAVLSAPAQAQQAPLYTQIYFLRMMYNPALTAYNGSTNLYGFYREQWTGIAGHPVTRGAAGEISLWKDRSGVGFHVYNDNTDIIHRVNAQLYYAQKVRLGKHHVLSLGVSGGIQNTQVDFSNARVVDQSDPNVLRSANGGVGFDMSVGLAYQWKKLTISAAIPHVSGLSVGIVSQQREVRMMNQRQFIGGISYEFNIKKEKFNIEPSVLFKKGFNTQPLQIDATVVANYKRMIYLGIGYRQENGINAMAAVRISRVVTLGYSYDYPVGSKATYAITNGTHEVLVGLCFDRWLKKGEKANNDDLQLRVKNLEEARKQDQARLDSLANKSNEKDEFNKQQADKIKELQDRIDSLQRDLEDYNKRISEKNVTRFNDKSPMEEGDIYRLDQVNFETNSSILKPESTSQLDKLSQVLLARKGMKIRVYGHTDFIASEEYNQWLSDRRAKRVVDYLVGKGVPAENITWRGYGKRAPIADNNTEEGRARNRRVEIDVVKKGE